MQDFKDAAGATHNWRKNTLPAVSEAMDRQGFRSGAALHKAFVVEASVRPLFMEQDTIPNYQTLLELTQGEGVFDRDGQDYTLRAYVLSCVLKTSPSQLFGEPPALECFDPYLDKQVEAPVEHDGYTAPECAVIERERREIIQNAVQELRPEHREVLSRHFGLAGEEPERIGEIAASMNKDRSWVSNTNNRALCRVSGKLNRHRVSSHTTGPWWCPTHHYVLDI